MSRPPNAHLGDQYRDASDLNKLRRPKELIPAVGNMHGMLKTMVAGATRKRLDIERIRAIKVATRVFMALHGASGTSDDDLLCTNPRFS
jgi:fructose/tagatose bisphosphate aldolase